MREGKGAKVYRKCWKVEKKRRYNWIICVWVYMHPTHMIWGVILYICSCYCLMNKLCSSSNEKDTYTEKNLTSSPFSVDMKYVKVILLEWIWFITICYWEMQGIGSSGKDPKSISLAYFSPLFTDPWSP